MKLICLDLYNKNLQRKSLASFSRFIRTKKHISLMLDQTTAAMITRQMHKCWYAWAKHIEEKRQRRLFLKEIEDYLKEKTMRQVFTSMRYNFEKKRQAKHAGFKVKVLVNHRLARNFMWIMMSKSNRKKLLKSKQNELINAKNQTLINHCFMLWFQKYSTLAKCEKIIKHKHQRRIKL